ncbi:hypothetical protein FKM82_012157 [Ascaphus truei]
MGFLKGCCPRPLRLRCYTHNLGLCVGTLTQHTLSDTVCLTCFGTFNPFPAGKTSIQCCSVSAKWVNM